MEKAKDDKETQKKKKKPYNPPPPPEDEKKKEEIKKRKTWQLRTFMQLDRGGNMVSNFFSNFLRQLNNPTHTGLLAKLLRIRMPEEKPQPERQQDIMGQAKTVFENGKAKPQYGEAQKNDSHSVGQNVRQSDEITIRQKTEAQPNVIPLNEPRQRGLRR